MCVNIYIYMYISIYIYVYIYKYIYIRIRGSQIEGLESYNLISVGFAMRKLPCAWGIGVTV